MTEQELLQMLKNLVSKDPMYPSDNGGYECYFCNGSFSNHLGDFKHNIDCSYVLAKKMIRKLNKT